MNAEEEDENETDPDAYIQKALSKYAGSSFVIQKQADMMDDDD